MLTPAQLHEIQQRLMAAKTCEDWGKLGFVLLFTPEKEGKNAAIWYGDGDQCAEVHGNLGLGISGDAMAEFFANSIRDVEGLLGMVQDKCCKDPGCHFCKTFADAVKSMVDNAVIAERLHCYQDVCASCASRSPFYTAEAIGPDAADRWHHRGKDGSFVAGIGALCHASAIRARHKALEGS